MKATYSFRSLQSAAKQIPTGLALALAVMFPLHLALANPAPVTFGTAGNFAVLAGAGITVTGPTFITGDIGTYPTPAITGFGNVTLVGTNHGNDAVTQVAQSDLTTAFNDAAGRPFDVTFGGGFDLVGLTLNAGVYHDATSLFLSGTLTLDGQNNPDAVWIFQTGSTLITASDSIVKLINGAQACHIVWVVGSSATLGTGTDFAGNILALSDITLTTGATVDGRLLARNGAVTLDTNDITMAICDTVILVPPDLPPSTVPDTGSTLLLLGSTMMGLIAFGKRF